MDRGAWQAPWGPKAWQSMGSKRAGQDLTTRQQLFLAYSYSLLSYHFSIFTCL